LRAAGTYLHARNSVAPLGFQQRPLNDFDWADEPCGAPGPPERIRNQAGLESGFVLNPQTNPELFVPNRPECCLRLGHAAEVANG
jgi:hypothetical protein